MENKQNVWERQQGEPEKSYNAFREYLNMERGKRSLISVSDKLGYKRSGRVNAKGYAKPAAILEQWSAKYKWRDRCAAFDASLDDAMHAEIIARDGEDIEVWVSRRKEIREQAYERAGKLLSAADKLLEKADAMLTVPLFNKQTNILEDGKTEIVLNPTDKWKVGDAASLIRSAASAAEIADKLRRLSADMVTDRVGVDFDLNDLPDEIVDDIAAGKIDPTTPDGRKTVLRLVEGSGVRKSA